MKKYHVKNCNLCIQRNFSSNIKISKTQKLLALDWVHPMTSKRPFRETKSLFESLIVIKKIMIKDYPKEFTVLVNFFKRFFVKR